MQRWLLTVLLVSGCGGPDSSVDAGEPGPDATVEDADSLEVCQANRDCDDGAYCNGPERCDPGVGGNGCTSGQPACSTDEVCDEEADRCQVGGWCVDGRDGCMQPGDCDGDSARAPECGGDDCDDDDGSTRPGGTEVCVFDDPTDEDCTPVTYGFIDIDEDGAADARCHNIDPRDGTRHGGTDCNDNNAAISPLAAEQCDGALDEDCDGAVDEGCSCSPEGVTRSCGSGMGVCAGAVETCTAAGWGACSVTPVTELCDGSSDEDCDGSVDEECSCVSGTTSSCGMGACVGTQRCVSGVYDACDGASAASMEICDGIDGDCDGLGDADDPNVVGVGASCGTDTGECSQGTNSCSGGSLVCGGSGFVGPSSETCNHLDQNCDGRTDESVSVASCSATFPPTLMAGTFVYLNYSCYPGGSGCGGDLTTGQNGGEAPRAAYYSEFRGDFGARTIWNASIDIRDTSNNGSAPAGNIVLLISPIREVGNDTDGPLPGSIPPLPLSNPAIAIVFYPTSGSFQIVYHSSTGWVARGSYAMLPSSCRTVPLTTTAYSFNLSNVDNTFYARVARGSCGATIELADSGLWNALYGAASAFPRYYLGVIADNDDDLAVDVRGLYIQRSRATPDSRNNCIGCP